MSDTEERDDRDFDVLEDDQNTSDAPSTDKDDDFDYLKEIEAIEAQERELEEQRQKKKAELDKLRAEHAKEEHKRSVQRKREMKERKKEQSGLENLLMMMWKQCLFRRRRARKALQP